MRKKKPIIGIVTRPITSISNRRMLGVYETYVKKIIQNGGIPIAILPPSNMDYIDENRKKEFTFEEHSDFLEVLKLCDGFLLPGGENPFTYDYQVIEYANFYDLPILGICMGMQAMANPNDEELLPVLSHYKTTHSILLKNHSKLKEIYGTNVIIVNSRHHFQVRKAEKYRISAISNDVVIEGIEREDRKFHIGVEWHPEDLEDNKLFKAFIEYCK